MNDDPQADKSALPLSEMQQIDKVCDAYEERWRSGERTSITDYCRQVALEARSVLFRQLLKLELEYRRQRDESPAAEEYVLAFGEYKPIIEGVFASDADTVDFHRAGDDTSDVHSKTGAKVVLELPPGTRMGGKFEVRQTLGSGAFGTVYLCWDTVLERELAVKLPHEGEYDTSEEFQNQLDEARNVARLEHPGIVPIYEGGTDEQTGRFYIAMKYVRGSTLAVRIKDRPPTVIEAARILADVAETLAFVHERDIVHRDLKPSNILLDENDRAFLTDFGLALSDEKRWERVGEYAGSPAYMSPEQVRGESHRLDGRTDVWALGVILYELLTGRRPFRGATSDQLRDELLYAEPKPPRMVNASIPGRLESICLKCLEKSVTERWSTATDVAKALRGEAVLGPNPYRGLAAFQEEDAELFFGREEQTVRAWERLRQLHEPPGPDEQRCRLVPVLGPSGCGKSSLVLAGLLAELRHRPLSGWDTFRVVILKPGARPVQSLALEFARLTGDVTRTTAAPPIAARPHPIIATP